MQERAAFPCWSRLRGCRQRPAWFRWFRVLAPHGTFRLALPDLEVEVNEYKASSAPDAAHRFLESTMLGVKSRRRGLRDFVRDWLGGSKHLWMWDYKSMEQELKLMGFVKIRRATYGDSAHPDFATVEDEDRWTRNLGIECSKP